MDRLADRLKNLTPLQRAVVALKETQARLEALECRLAEPIALVGMACRFPGGAVDPQSYWQLLCAGVDAIRETPPERWDVDRFYDPDPAVPGKMCTRWGGYLDGIDAFDNRFFGISEREALRIDPQQRLLLELAWEVLEDAGLPPSSLRGTKTGVFVGIAASEYGIMLAQDVAQTDAHAAAGTALCLAANRLSFVLGLQGPSLALDTACSSSLVAVHLACQLIRNGDCEMALAGGTNLILSPLGTINLTKTGFCAKDGRVRAFDAAASGCVRSEGAGLVALKPLSAALKNGDPIYAVIRGSAVNQNGASNGLTAPSRAAQEQVLREAYARAKVAPGQIQYVETQGTGTRLGDTIEALALGSVLGEGRPPGNRCPIGSVKTNIGHMETAAGIASLMKTALALQHCQLPANLHFQTPNPDIPFDRLPLRVVQKLEPWPAAEQPRLAGVSAFGFGGSNAHVVLEAAPATPDNSVADGEGGPGLLPLSARTEKALRDLAVRYVEFLGDNPPCWRDVCYTAAVRRDHHDCRLAVLAATPAEARSLLAAYLDGNPRPGVYAGRKPYGRSLKIAFVYDGHAETSSACGAHLARSLPGFATALESIDDTVDRVLGRRLAPVIRDDGNGRPCSPSELLALQLALTAWCRSAGMTPDVVLGRGAGELAAACAAGILTAEEALSLAAGSERAGGGPLPPVQARAALLPFISSVDGQSHLGRDLDPTHWQSCLGRQQDWDSAAEALAQCGTDFCLRLGDCAAAAAGSFQEARDISLATLGLLYSAGADLGWGPLAPTNARCVRLPSYPWQKQRLWVASDKWMAILPFPPAAGDAPGAVTATESCLPPRLRPRPDMVAPYVAPRSALEESLAKAWSAALGIEEIGIHDNFFELGGDSLQATILLNRLREDLGQSLPNHVLFEVQTIGDLAAYLQDRCPGEAPAISAPAGSSSAGRPVPAGEQVRSAPLSTTQQRLWLLDRLDPENPAYNIPMALRLSGPVDRGALDRAMEEMVARHETLRTKIEMRDDEPRQIISAATPQELPLVDLTEMDPARREAEVAARAEAEARRPFRLSEGPLFRTLLLRLATTEHVLVIVMHHVITDDWSTGVLFRELATLYQAFAAGRPSPLPGLPIQYADYAAWQRQYLQGETLDRLLDYWRRRLEGLSTLELPTDRPRPPQVTHAGAVFRSVLPAALADRLKEVGRREGATLYMTLLAAFQVLLHRYSGQDDFAVGSPIAGRVRKDTEGLVGFLANTLVMRADLTGNPTFRETLHRVRQTALEAYQHQEMPFEGLVEALNPPRDPSRHPLFQVLFTLQNAPWPKVRLADLTISHVPLDNQTAKVDLWMSMRETETGLQTEVEYNVALFEAATIERMMGHLETLLESIAADADRPIGLLPILTDHERRQILLEWNGTRTDSPKDRCIHEVVEEQAERTPEAVALVFGDQRLTYGELNSRANQLAHYLRRLGVGPDDLVAVYMDRSLELVVALLGILKAGGAYLPMDLAYPPDRLAFMLQDSNAKILITQEGVCDQLSPNAAEMICLDRDWQHIGGENVINPSGATTPDNLAYVIYTSGSTGRPKGVLITHANVARLFRETEAWFHFGPSDIWTLFHSYAFDFSVWELWGGLLYGGRVVIVPYWTSRSPELFYELLGREQVTVLNQTPSAFSQLIAAEQQAGKNDQLALRLVIFGGEALNLQAIKPWFDVHGDRHPQLVNMYGITETTVHVTYYPLSCADLERPACSPIGRPIPDLRVYVRDLYGNLSPIGMSGELCVGGRGVARGYLNRPDLSDERFVPDPYVDQPEARLYKAGDLARWLPDGNLEYLGRLDHQVKIRGFRIELGEIESCLRRHPAIQDVVVVAREDSPGDKRLVAYLVAKDEELPAVAELRSYLTQDLPEYMVPSAFTTLKALPLTPNGKVDRRALPVPDSGRPAMGQEFVAPRDETEIRLAEIWQEILHVDRVGIHDNFFALGGHSLLAAQVASRIARQLHAELPLREMFEAATIAELAERVQAAASGGIRDLGPPIVPVPRDGQMLPSFTQEALWFLDQLERGRATYTIYTPLRIKGRLNLATTERALNEILRRHESLRTRFPEVDGRPVQVIEPPQPRVLPLVDLEPLPEAQRESRLRQWIVEEMERPIDLQNGPLIRITMLRLSADDHVAMVSAHHIIYDGWSMTVLLRELTALYTAFEMGRPSPLPELQIQHADFAAWQRQWLQGEEIERLRSYWVKQLSGVAPLELPADHPRPSMRTTRGTARLFDLSPETGEALMEFCRREGVTPFMTLLAAFEVLLQRYSGQDDIVVGTPVANRSRPETEALIGYFVNVLVLRNDLSGDPSFREVLRRARQVALGAYDHQEMTLDQVVAAVNPPRDMSRHPLFQVMFALQNIELPQLDLFGLSMTPLEDVPAPLSAYFDLTLALWQSGAAFCGEWNFNTDLFQAETIERMARHFETLLATAIAQPDRSLSTLPLLAEDEQQRLLVQWNQTTGDYPREACVHELFASRAEQSPEALAVVLDDQRWTYGQLNERANQLARFLQRQGVGRETRVGICLERSPQLLMAVLGVLKAGGAYVPLDPTYTRDAEERLKYVLQDAQVSLVLTSSDLAAAIGSAGANLLVLDDETAESIGSENPSNVAAATGAENLAYVLYTSGSTGRPKGVMVTHRNLVNAYYGWLHAYRLDSDVRAHLQMASFGFDVFGGDMVRALCSGGKLVICPKETLLEPERLLRLIRRENVDIGEFVPVILRHLVQYLEDTDQRLDSLRLVIVGSDAWYVAEHKRALRRLGPNTRLINSYGLTETTIDSSCFEGDADMLPDAALVPIGRPFANVRLYVLDGRMQPVPVGVPGDLYIGGDGISRGYVNAELNAERFPADPFVPEAGARLCRTGDRARWRADGQVEFLGRADSQVKIRGFRVEPGEIEEVLGEHPALAQAAVAPRQRAAGDLLLVAYVVGKTGAVPDAAEMKQFLARRLPDYMVPTAFVSLDALPTTSSGKVDRKSLPAPDWSRVLAQGEFVAPRPGTEQRLAAIWSEVLEFDRIGAHDNFFDLGVSSLMALRLVSRVRAAFSVDLPLVTLFTAPTVASLALAVEKMRGESHQEADLSVEPVDRDAEVEIEPAIVAPPPRSSVGKSHSLVPLRAAGSARPLFCIHGLGGHVAAFVPLAQGLADDRPVYGLQAQGLDPGQEPHDRIEAMAAWYVREIQDVQPRGPYLLGGWSMGGLIALEAARQLLVAGQKVALVAMFDTYLSVKEFQDQDMGEQSVLRRIALQLDVPITVLQGLPLDEQWERIAKLAEQASGIGVPEIRRLAATCKAHVLAMSRYELRPYAGPCVLLPAAKGRSGRDLRWPTVCPKLCIEPVPGDHFSMLREPHVEVLVERLGRYLHEFDGDSGSVMGP